MHDRAAILQLWLRAEIHLKLAARQISAASRAADRYYRQRLSSPFADLRELSLPVDGHRSSLQRGGGR